MTVLITGVAGFLGSHLADRFIDEGHDVVGIDNLLTGAKTNLDHLDDHRGFTFIEANVTSYIAFHEPLAGILHMASPASPLDYLTMPIQTLKVGALGTHNALGLALAKDARLLLASTSEVYGDPLEHPQTEEYWGNVNPVGPRGVYDEAKRFAEALAVVVHDFEKVQVEVFEVPEVGVDRGVAVEPIRREVMPEADRRSVGTAVVDDALNAL